MLRCSAASVFAALREQNGLLPLELPPGVRGATPIGRLKRRGRDVPVVWMRARRDFFLSALGLRQQLGGDGLIVVVPKLPGVHFAASEQIAVLELPLAEDGHLGLARGLDELDPNYRKKAAGRDEPDAEVDWVRLHFATTDARHVLLVNGHDFVGFRQGDVLFARLLLLAAARKFTRRGWVHKASLVGDFAEVPAEAGHWKLHATTRGNALSGKQADGVNTATLLLAEARRLGLPGESIAVPSPVPATSRATRRRRSAP